jgi:hypothetical protein
VEPKYIALLTNNNVRISATTSLNHEIDHAASYDNDPKKYLDERKPENRSNFYDPDYENKEEKRVITGSEQRTARAMGEISGNQVTRTDHGAQAIILTNSPNSTVGTPMPIGGPLPEINITVTKRKKSKS